MRSSASCCLSSNWRKKVKRILFKKKYWKDKKIPTNSALNKINFQFTFSMVANFQYQIIKNWISGNNFFQSHNFAFSTGFMNCIFTIPCPFSLDFSYSLMEKFIFILQGRAHALLIFLPIMNYINVFLQVSCLRKCLFTDVTSMILLYIMNCVNVLLQGSCLRKCLFT